MNMRLSFLGFLSAAVAAGISVSSFAAGWEVDTSAKTLTYKDANDAVVWQFSCSFAGSDGKNITLAELKEGSGDLDLRGIPDGYKVVNLGKVFFVDKSSQRMHLRLSSLIEPDELTILNQYEFYNYNDKNNSNFTNFTGGGSVTRIESEAFRNCGKLKGKLNFPNLETMTGGLGGCPSLQEISMPKLTVLPNSAFSECSSVTNFDLNWAELTSIGDAAFQNCTKLKGDLVMPKLTKLGSLRATGVTSVDAPNTEYIGDYAFYQTVGLTNANFGAKVTRIGDDRVFYQCAKLVGDFSFPLMTYVPKSMFVDTKVTSVSFPSATEIHDNAFAGCSTITNFVLNYDIITSVGDNAFASTKISGDLRFPNATRITGFKWAHNVTSIYAPKAETVGLHFVYGNTGVTNIVLGSGVKTIVGEETFCNASNLKGDFDFSKVASFPKNFMYGTKVGSLALTNATTFGATCFQLIQTLTNISLCAATALPEKLFYRCSPGCSVQFYGDVPTFGKNVFSYWKDAQHPNYGNTVFFHIRNRAYLANWTAACFALRGTSGFEPYKAKAPRRTIGVMHVGPAGAVEGERDLAYVIDGTPTGFMLLVR